MCGCSGNLGNISTEAPEYNKRFKSENNGGCCYPRQADTCSNPSKATEGSVLWSFEQIYGKVLNSVTQEIGENGRFHLVHTKTLCPEVKNRRNKGCCSVKYRVSR